MALNNIISMCRKKLATVLASLFVIALIAGCSSTKTISGQILINKNLPPPKTIWVSDFITNPADIHANISPTEKISKTNKPLTPEETQKIQQLGKSIASQLVKQINAMGLHAKQTTSSSKPQVNDIVLSGYIYSVEAGNKAERIFIGMGYGASKLNTIVEGYQMTPKGLHKLSSAVLVADSNKMPGGGGMSVVSFILTKNPISLILGPAIKGVQEIGGSPTLEGRVKDTASKIADSLKIRFQEEGWISKDNKK
jgi:hypothetical protein